MKCKTYLHYIFLYEFLHGISFPILLDKFHFAIGPSPQAAVDYFEMVEIHARLWTRIKSLALDEIRSGD